MERAGTADDAGSTVGLAFLEFWVAGVGGVDEGGRDRLEARLEADEAVPL